MCDGLLSFSYTSDADGMRFALADATKFDLSDWRVVEISDDGAESAPSEIERGAAWIGSRGGLSLNPYLPAKKFCQAWAIAVGRGGIQLISPDGHRHALLGPGYYT